MSDFDDYMKSLKGSRGNQGETGTSWPPKLSDLTITLTELAEARNAPDCIIENMIFADLCVLAAAGGTGKTVFAILMAVHIILGLPLFGNKIKRMGKVVFITAEDKREYLVARLRHIMEEMDLDDLQKRKVMNEFLIIDVVGENRPLIFIAPTGGIESTNADKKIIEAFQDENINMIVFDPLISFGASESLINDNEQAIATVCRNIIKQLNVCVLLITHTGQSNARNKTNDAYASRGGTALPDAARMVLVLHPSDKHDKRKPPLTLSIAPDDYVLELIQPKLSYAPTPPTIWITRNGYKFAGVKESKLKQDPKILAREFSDQLDRFLISEYENGRRYTKTQLEDAKKEDLGMTREQLRKAVADLQVSRRIIDAELPKQEQQGRKKYYLHPAELKTRDGGIDEK